ncbi:mandelate racemase/muconate lactonizing enzyme family protein [Marinigracilibium pacificum]|uniref:Mandelate racemase/muconate lactonizing enzyme family protein n=1 Tax=Marinigracilibium pacificum TaxID=2729599 RepID=A0A848IZY1_9BACT|nr:mandelate racemase/muconate lactonizing enzyme family protein [Marinigracilibium pacificum]NMM47559.1 mandelate racemase/muconate lactonizing enzyme family protein [Marinigracilibium pacificum]
MKSTRRNFFKKAALTGLAGSVSLSTFGAVGNKWANSSNVNEKYKKLDEILTQPVLKKDLFKSPLIIKNVELSEYQGNYICQVTTEDGHKGISVSNNLRMHYLYPIFVKQVAPYFIGKDARELDALIEGVYTFKSNYKMQSYALWVPVATLEFAILDLLGKIAGLPMGQLVGDVYNKEVGVYQANNYRGKSAEESIELLAEKLAETKSKALKFKIGGRMNNPDTPPGRSEKLIPLVRKRFGDDIAVYVDANSSYNVEEAIKIGRLIEENNFNFFEEPIPFDWYEEIKVVKDALKVPIAGGEQEGSMHNFRWLLANDALDIVQQDIFYFGGMIRAMKVAKMAHALGKTCVPHISGSGLGYLYMLHFVSVIPNAGPHHEFKGFNEEIPFECDSCDMKIVDGKIKVPTGPGSSIEIDPDFINKHVKI